MLGEVYGMTSGDRSKRIESALNKALVYHREVQSRQKEFPSDIGGWRYGYPESPTASSDMSVTGWALMFLRSARNAEFNIPKQYFDEGLDFVERCYEIDASHHDKGVFRYRPAASSMKENPQITLANTSSAVLSLILGGRQDQPSVAVCRALVPQPRLSETLAATLFLFGKLLQQSSDGAGRWRYLESDIPADCKTPDGRTGCRRIMVINSRK